MLTYWIVKLRVPILVGLIIAVPFVGTFAGYVIIGVVGTIVAFWAASRQLHEEYQRARAYVADQYQQNIRASRQSGAVENPRWWAGHGLRGIAATARAAGRAVRGLRDHMRSPRPGTRSPEAREDARRGPFRRIIGAGVRASRAAREAAGNRRQRRAEDLRNHRWRPFLGGLWPGREAVRDALHVGRCWDCGAVCAAAALLPTLVATGPGRREWVRLCAYCRSLHAPAPPNYAPAAAAPAIPAIEQAAPAEDDLDAIPAAGQPELAPATHQPAQIGAPMAGQLSPWAPNPAQHRGSGTVGVNGGNAARHSAWMRIQDLIEDAIKRGVNCGQNISLELAYVDAGESQRTDGDALLKRTYEFLQRIQKGTDDVDSREGPIVAARTRAGGPRETADTSYHEG